MPDWSRRSPREQWTVDQLQQMSQGDVLPGVVLRFSVVDHGAACAIVAGVTKKQIQDYYLKVYPRQQHVLIGFECPCQKLPHIKVLDSGFKGNRAHKDIEIVVDARSKMKALSENLVQLFIFG